MASGGPGTFREGQSGDLREEQCFPAFLPWDRLGELRALGGSGVRPSGAHGSRGLGGREPDTPRGAQELMTSLRLADRPPPPRAPQNSPQAHHPDALPDA